MSSTGHWRIVYPEGTPQGVKRTSFRAAVYLVTDDEEIKVPGVTGMTLSTAVNDADRITLEAIGTVEVSYDGPAVPDADRVAPPLERDDDMDALMAALREEPETQ